MEVCYIGFSFYSFIKLNTDNFIKLRHLFRFLSNSGNLINTKLKFLVPLSILICPKYRLPSQIDFNKCREEIANAINEFCKRWC